MEMIPEQGFITLFPVHTSWTATFENLAVDTIINYKILQKARKSIKLQLRKYSIYPFAVSADHALSNFLTTVYIKLYLVHSWVLCLIWHIVSFFV